MALLDVEKAYAEYKNALDMLRSAEDRIKASKEVLRVIELRYKKRPCQNGGYFGCTNRIGQGKAVFIP